MAVWEFDNSGPSGAPEWVSIAPDLAKTLEACFNSGVKSLSVDFGGFPYAIDLQALCQQNLSTGRVRKLRRVGLPAGEGAAASASTAVDGADSDDSYDSDLEFREDTSSATASSVVWALGGGGPSSSTSGYHASHHHHHGGSSGGRATKLERIVVEGGDGYDSESEDSGDDSSEAGKRDRLQATMFADMGPSDITSDEHCQICLVEFIDEDDSESSAAASAASGKRPRSPNGVSGRDGAVGSAESAPIDCIKLTKCFGHYFHKECIAKWFETKPKCPTCQAFYGEEKGNQPGGSMTIQRSPASLPGFADCGTITIEYSIKSGVQSSSHPNPGVPFYGTRRLAFLPDNADGNRVLELLKRAFRNRVIFTVGRSLTTGQDNCVTWNGIHHKTSQHGGTASFGYPDSTYLNRVTFELAAKGIL